MKRLIILSTAFFLAAGVAFGQKNVPIKSTWTTATTFADQPSIGSNAPGEVYLENAKIHALATNSADKLFLTIQLNNDSDQFKALLFGSTIWLDQKSKKKSRRGIQFPLPEELDPATGKPLSMAAQTGPTDRGMMMKQLLSRKIEMKLIHLVAEDEMLVSASGDPSGITGKIEEKAGRLVYQLAIPLALINGKPGSDEPLAIAFETGVPEKPKQTSSDAGSMSGMGGMYGGGMYGRRGMYGGGRGFSGPTIAPTRFALAVQLAAP
ncbi:hypothetical protein LX87_03680 [Larkinella arboricola]|uniref:Uncharacterized protein n=1 Tax=Larkinella arboricola TaxID=643671 RepID=A0A327WU36_LARAB|nr:hypothetical protein [Larkinella arboricola]RAJ95930.1 hypothetical protein LX87_03680 [Larkinella arboricola]